MSGHRCEQVPCPWCDLRPSIPPAMVERSDGTIRAIHGTWEWVDAKPCSNKDCHLTDGYAHTGPCCTKTGHQPHSQSDDLR